MNVSRPIVGGNLGVSIIFVFRCQKQKKLKIAVNTSLCYLSFVYVFSESTTL